jgi:hypothetical protein
MRFSVLTLRLPESADPDDDHRAIVDHIATFMTTSNVSCVCVQDCLSGSSHGNPGQQLLRRVSELGGRYELAYLPPAGDDSRGHSGGAILAQLPLMSTATAESAVAVRLAVAPTVQIDVITSGLSRNDGTEDSDAAALGSFLDASAGMLSPAPPPPRRGRPPRMPPPSRSKPVVRIVMVAGVFPGGPSGPAGEILRAGGFADVSARQEEHSAGDFLPNQSGCAPSVFVRPAIRPTDSELLPAEEPGAGGGSPCGLLLGFEV